jgi:hypothetical protein
VLFADFALFLKGMGMLKDINAEGSRFPFEGGSFFFIKFLTSVPPAGFLQGAFAMAKTFKVDMIACESGTTLDRDLKNSP